MKIYRFCLKDKSSILGILQDEIDINCELNNNKFISYKNITSKKVEYLNVDSISIVRESSRDQNGNKIK